MPIDRVFVVHGHGLVVTGTAVAGTVSEGDTVRLLPGGETARIRGVETHGSAVASAGRRQRIALNLAGAERADVARGHVVCAPVVDRTTDRLDAWIEVRPGARRGLRHHARVRVHIGTAEVFGKVVLLDRRARLDPGGRTWAQLALSAPVVAMRGDRFILRDETARFTVAGGVVVHPFADRHGADPRLSALLESLRTGDDAAAAGAFLRLVPEFAVTAAVVASALDLDDARSTAALAQAPGLVPLPDAATPEAYTTTEQWDRFESVALGQVLAAHARDPLAPGLDLESLRTGLPWEVPLRAFRWGIDRLVMAGRLVRDESIVRVPEHRVALGREQGALGERLVQVLQAGGLTPPDLRQLEDATRASRKALLEVLGVLEKERRVVRVAADLFYHPDAVDEGRRRIAEYCAAHGDITAAAFRDLIGASRKFAIAFLDWCDRTGVTLRIGDVRRLRR
jgi:selenocysteine-specific elongation factor